MDEDTFNQGLNEELIQLKRFSEFSPKDMKENKKELLNYDLLNTVFTLNEKMNEFPEPGAILRSKDRILLMNMKDFITGFYNVFKHRMDHTISIYDDLVKIKEKALNEGASYEQPKQMKIVKRVIKKPRLGDINLIDRTQLSEDESLLISMFGNMRIVEDETFTEFPMVVPDEQDENFGLNQEGFDRALQLMETMIGQPQVGIPFQDQLLHTNFEVPNTSHSLKRLPLQENPRVSEAPEQPRETSEVPEQPIETSEVPEQPRGTSEINIQKKTKTIEKTNEYRSIDKIFYAVNQSHKLILSSAELLSPTEINQEADYDEDDDFNIDFKDSIAPVSADYVKFLVEGSTEERDSELRNIENFSHIPVSIQQPTEIEPQAGLQPTEIEPQAGLQPFEQDNPDISRPSLPMFQSPIQVSREEINNEISPEKLALLDRIKSMTEKEANGIINFAQLFPVMTSTRLEVTQGFSGILSLFSSGLIEVHQESPSPRKIFIQMHKNVVD